MKKILIFVLCFALCLMFVSCMDSTYDSSNTESTDESTESVTEKSSANTSTTAETTDDDIAYGVDVELSIFPHAWRSMNAMIVTFGEIDELSWSIDYKSVGVENVEILSSTMSESPLHDNYLVEYSYEEVVSGIDYLLISDEYLDDIVEGETALVFTTDTGLASANDDGESVFEFCFVLRYSIIPIVDGKLVLPDDFSKSLTYYLTKGNTFMEKNYPDVDIRFEDGMTVEEFGEFVEYLCTEADGLIYP
ncbi:MAG: hypothetical protein LUI15_00725 [Firmicutes bacterium]|nr:hypothetical protein [Bacillota bacterium]MCD7788016.1 hypothetical protein [Bacillota bacterium]MCD7831025.1 hypothetical protein [Bacillota bacterium]